MDTVVLPHLREETRTVHREEAGIRTRLLDVLSLLTETGMLQEMTIIKDTIL